MPRGVLETRHDRHVLAEVSVEQDHPGDIRTPLELLAQDGGGAVAAAVVDEDDFVAGFQFVERRVEALEQGLQTFFLVVDRNDDGDVRIAHCLALSMISLMAAHTRSTSCSDMSGNSGRVTVSRPIFSA